jgi:hypothetical protein
MPRLVKTVVAAALVSLLPALVHAAPLTPGNVFVYRVGATGGGALAGTATPVFIDEFTTAGTLVQSLAMPTMAAGANGALTGSGTATSDGLLSVSGNGQFLMLTGYDTPIGAAGNVVSNALPRTVGRIALDGSVNTTTRLTDPGASNFRGVASTNGTDLWVSGASSGVRYTTLGASTSTQLSTTVTNTRAIGIADSQVFVSTGSGTSVRVGTVGTGLPTTSGQTITNLPGFVTAGSPYAFFFADLSVAVPGLDTLYVADDAAGLQKYSLNAGNWVLKGTVGLGADMYRGLTGVVNGGTVSLFATSATTTVSKLVSLSDASGYDGSFTSALTTLSTSGANTLYRGVALLPVPEPSTWALMLGGLALVAGWARRARG